MIKNNSYFRLIKGGVTIKRGLILVLLVTVLLSVSALSAADTNTNSNATNDINDNTVASTTQAKSVTNIESNSIENKVSNEYETITNVNSSSSGKTLNKQVKTSNTTTKTATSTTSKQSINIKSSSITAYANQLITINATVTYNNGEKLKNAKVAIKINDKTIGQTNVTNGKVSYKYTIPTWSAKTYNLSFVVGETSTSLKGTKTVQLTIKRHSLKITMPTINATSALKKTISAKVLYENGTLANGQKAVFKLNGVTIGTTTVKKGVASITYILPVKAATYNLQLKVGESTVSKAADATSKLTVTKRTPVFSMDKLFFLKSGNSVTLKVKLSNTGNANATGKITFKIDGKTVGSGKLSGNTASYVYKDTGLKTGYHVISMVYAGSSGLKARTVNSSLRVQKELVSTYTYSQVLQKANLTYDFILKNKRLPNFATINGNQLSMSDFLYLMVQAVSYNNSYHNGAFSTPTTTTKTSKYDVKVNTSDYVSLAKKIVTSYIVDGKCLNTVKTSSGVKLSFNDTVYMYVRVCNFLYTKKKLPNYSMVLKVSQSSSSSGSSSSGSSSGSSSSSSGSSGSSTYVPSNKVPSGYEKYLVNANNAYVNSTTLKNAVKSAVSGVSGTYNQAKAIFNYVNDKTSYSSYSNTRYGAIQTLKNGYGNCVDQSHLLLGMLRTANIPARYCHAKCYFRSGLVVGHVWVETYVNGKWYSCDTTSNQNTFGNIVNWYSSGTVYRYTELYF